MLLVVMSLGRTTGVALFGHLARKEPLLLPFLKIFLVGEGILFVPAWCIRYVVWSIALRIPGILEFKVLIVHSSQAAFDVLIGMGEAYLGLMVTQAWDDELLGRSFFVMTCGVLILYSMSCLVFTVIVQLFTVFCPRELQDDVDDVSDCSSVSA